VLAHAAYLVNLGSEDPDIREKSIAGFADELDRCALLGIPWLILHPGTHPDPVRGIELIAEGLDEAMRRADDTSTVVLLENTAGQGSAVGQRLEELATIRSQVAAPERIAYCLDTCHLYAAGYDLSTPEAHRALLDEIEAWLGLERVKAFHLNDSKKGLGSKVDRHDEIGEGALGLEPFRRLVNEKLFAHAVAVVETPDPERYRETLEKLRGLRTKKRT